MFGSETGYFERALTNWSGVVVTGGDVDGDGRDELLANRTSRSKLLVSRLGRFPLAAEELVTFRQGIIVDQVMVDANGDGLLDLAVITRDAYSINTWLEVALTAE